MNCLCGADSTVYDSRVRRTSVHRGRRCLGCGARWRTVEVVDLELKRHTDTGAKVGRPMEVPEAHRVVRFFFGEVGRQGWSYDAVERMSRVAHRTFNKWRTCRVPRVDTLDQALAPLGYELWVRRIEGGRDA